MSTLRTLKTVRHLLQLPALSALALLILLLPSCNTPTQEESRRRWEEFKWEPSTRQEQRDREYDAYIRQRELESNTDD